MDVAMVQTSIPQRKAVMLGSMTPMTASNVPAVQSSMKERTWDGFAFGF